MCRHSTFHDRDCEKPHDPRATMYVSEIVNPFDSFSNAVNPQLKLICSGNLVEVQFNEDAILPHSFGQMFGRTYTLELSNVQDRAGNVMETYSYSSNFECHPPNPRIVVTHSGRVNQHYLPGEAIVFDVSLTNDRPADEWTRARLELGVDLTSNTGDLTVLFNGSR